MNKIELEDTDLTIPELAKLAKSGTVILTRRGKPILAVRPVPSNDWESLTLANDPRFVKLIEESRRAYVEEGGTSLEDVCKDLGLKIKSRRHQKRNGRAARR